MHFRRRFWPTKVRVQRVALTLHRAPDTSLLAEELGNVLAIPLADPFEQDVVVVPARGIERWLTQRLSHKLGVGPRGGDGVTAGVRFITPHSLISLLLDRTHSDPWSADHLSWPVLAAIEDNLDQEWAQPIADHLGVGKDGSTQLSGRRFSLARRLATLFSSYAVQRPEMLRAWSAEEATDGYAPLAADLEWQPYLWREVTARVSEPAPDQQLATTLERLRSNDTGHLNLPDRLSLFGHTRLARSELALLEALGQHRDIHLWLPQTSATLWDKLAPLVADGVVHRTADDTASQASNPILSAFGRDARELQRSLAGIEYLDSPVDVPAPAPQSMLSWLQADIRADREATRAEVADRDVSAQDRSVQVHSCHGPARQVEVLRDVLAGLLEDDPTLEPRDILVMCPRVDDYAPLIQAQFGMLDVPGAARKGHPAHQFRVRLADRGARHTNPLLSFVIELLSLADSRVTASQVKSLMAAPPVQARFSFDEDSRDLAGQWIEAASIEWGLDADHLDKFSLKNYDQNSWERGLERIITGIPMDAVHGGHLPSISPLEWMGSGDIDLVGRLVEFMTRLRHAVHRLAQSRTAGEWSAELRHQVQALTQTPADLIWQQTQLDRELERLSERSDPDITLSLAEVRSALIDRLGGRPTRANFRTGTLTVCSLVPMRSVPHRVVVLLGMDDQSFPRQTLVDGDDALGRNPLTGERDSRSEDRQLMLDAVMAARDTLVVTYTGANEHSGAEQPPAVPVGELIDATHTTVPMGHTIVISHPLHPFDRRNVEPGALIASEDRPFTFDRAAVAGANRANLLIDKPQAPRDQRLPALPPASVDLNDLIKMLINPFAHYRGNRLGLADPPGPEESEHDSIPIELDGLKKWEVADRLLANLLSGQGEAEAGEIERLRGTLPPHALGNRVLDEVGPTVGALAAGARQVLDGERRWAEINIDLGDGRRLEGTVPGAGPLESVHLVHQRLVQTTYSRISAKHRIAAWVRLLALCAGHPSQTWSSIVFGRRSKRPAALTYSGISPEAALAELHALVDLHDRGLCEPLPAMVNTSYAYFDATRNNPQNDLAGRYGIGDHWMGSKYMSGDREDSAVVALWGQHASLDRLLEPARDDESWTRSHQTRIGQLSMRIWQSTEMGNEQWSNL